MKYIAIIILLALCLMNPAPGSFSENDDANENTARFEPLHIYIDSGDHHLAAFQFELSTLTGSISIVGVEGSDDPAYKEPPYYDPEALSNDRIIIAAYSTNEDLPAGKIKVATIHLQITGQAEPEYDLDLIVAADIDGNEIPAQITFEKGEQSEKK